jgi:hypothetical protein
MFPSQGIPQDVDAETHRRIARTFLVLRMVKGGLLLIFLAGMLVAIEAKEWPRAATALVGVGIFLEVLFLASSWRRYSAIPRPTEKGGS